MSSVATVERLMPERGGGTDSSGSGSTSGVDGFNLDSPHSKPKTTSGLFSCPSSSSGSPNDPNNGDDFDDSDSDFSTSSFTSPEDLDSQIRNLNQPFEFTLTEEEAIAILKEEYGPIENPLSMSVNGGFEINTQQSAKKIKHAPSFGIKLENYGFSKEKALKIDRTGLGKYLQKGNDLPSRTLTRAYQQALKNFCEDRTKSKIKYNTTFRGKSSITFYNEKTFQVVVFDKMTKKFITGYKVNKNQMAKFLEFGSIGEKDK